MNQYLRPFQLSLSIRTKRWVASRYQYSLQNLKLSLASIMACGLLLTGCDQAKPAERYFDVTAEGAYSLRFSQNAEQLLVGSIFHGGSLWRLRPIDRLFNWNHQAEGYSSLTSGDFSADGNFVATADTRTIALWSRRSGEAVWFWNAPADIKDLALSRSGRYAILAMDDYTVTVFDIKNGGIRRRFPHEGIVYDVSLTRDNSLVASASDDLTAGVWNLQTGQRLLTLKHSNQVRTAQLSPSGRYLLTSADGQAAQLWDVSSGRLIRKLGNTRGHYSAVRFSDNEKLLLTGNTSGQVQLWQISNGVLRQTWRAASQHTWVRQAVPIEDVAFENRQFLAAGANGRIYWFKE